MILKKSNRGKYVVFCAIWYHLYNLENVKNIHAGVLLLVQLQALSKCYQIAQCIKYLIFLFFSEPFFLKPAILYRKYLNCFRVF